MAGTEIILVDGDGKTCRIVTMGRVEIEALASREPALLDPAVIDKMVPPYRPAPKPTWLQRHEGPNRAARRRAARRSR